MPSRVTRRRFLESAATLAAGTAAGCATYHRKTQPAKRPNVLWLMTDEQRRDSMGCYGSPWAATPNLDALARDGVVFTRAVTPAPLCTPARCSLLTGRYPSETGVWTNHDGASPPLPFLTEVFHAAGYDSATFGKQHYSSRNRAFQVEKGPVLSRAVDYFKYAPQYDARDYDVVQYPNLPYRWIFGGRYPEPIEHAAEYQVAAQAKQWLEERDTSRPFLLRLSFNCPHTPVSVVAPFDTIIPEGAVQFPPETESPPDEPADWLSRDLCSIAGSDCMGREEILKARRYYNGYVSYADHLFGDFLRWMDGRGLLENTIVGFVSDHGTHIGDFGLFQKQTFYEPAATVPYFFWYPRGIARGARLDVPVSTRTLLPTLLELSGLEPPEGLQGASLARQLRRGVKPERAPVFSGFTLASFERTPGDKLRPGERIVMVRDGSWKLSLIHSPEPHDGFLVNLDEDPFERRNLYGRPEAAKEQGRLAGLIGDHLAAGRQPYPGCA
ncbi:MAG TPA: sulfatase-like hydrolase/transferase [Candidatus Bathyarchaeia archaeon]|nr:sulfatase-like hydrolase/transferase [Candidatus Bathyarchaeia archaeon]